VAVGCQGFFKRTVQNKKNYVCMRGAQCQVVIATRKKCPACRYASSVSDPDPNPDPDSPVHKFLGLSDPDPLVTGLEDPDRIQILLSSFYH
jgi:hypothetical protein